MTRTASVTQLAERASKARTFMRAQGLRGWDPYDALLSPAFRLPLLRSRWFPRFVAQQGLLRSPVNLRPLLRVPVQLNAVTVGLYVQGLADLASAGVLDREVVRTEAGGWIENLEELASPGHAGACWGYPFPWEGRRHRMPTGLPTVVATGIVVNGLHRAWRKLGNERARRLVASSAAFLLNEVPRAAGNDEAFCWAYSSADRQAVLNATMKGTRLLVQAVDAGLEDARALPSAKASARFVAAHQDPDGGWPYAVHDPRSWRDHHHTGYVLECFNTYRRLTNDTEFDGEIERGWGHYRSTLFRDSLPRFYDDRDGPLDATAAGQALITLATFDEISFGLEVASATTAILDRADGSFAYQRRRGRLTRTQFMRWSTAWMFAGMSALLSRVVQ